MYGMNRNTIYGNLFKMLEDTDKFKTISQTLQMWNQVPPSEQPALFQVQKSEVADSSVGGLPTKWTLHVDLYVYCHDDDNYDLSIDCNGNLKPAVIKMNELLDIIDDLMTIDEPDGYKTLGNTVYHCAIDGEIITDEGYLGKQRVAIVPVLVKLAENEFKISM